MKEQHAEVAAKKVEQAEARLQFLLNQSDIFAHFGVGKKPLEGAMSPSVDRKKAAAGEHRQRGAAVAELDDEELEMIEEEDADEEVVKKKRRIGDVISKQPSVITGEMRCPINVISAVSCRDPCPCVCAGRISWRASTGWYVCRTTASMASWPMRWDWVRCCHCNQ